MKTHFYTFLLLLLCTFYGFGQCTNTVSPDYTESFESGLALWTNNPNNDINWNIGTGNVIGSNGASDGNNFIFISNASTSSAQNGILSSPCLNLTNCSASDISFDYFFNGPQNTNLNGSLTLEVSTDNGATWTTFWSLPTLSTPTWQSGASSNISLNQFLGQTIQLRFNRTSAPNASRSFGIDNINITCSPMDPTPDPCDIVSINITSETPNCNIFENSSTFDICGTFTTSSSATGYNLTYNINSPNTFPNISNFQITPSNVTSNNGIISGNFCITLNQSNYNPVSDQINFQITSKINGIKCSDTTGYFSLPYDDCDDTSDCALISEAELSNNVLSWENIPNTTYTIQFIVDYSCFGDPHPSLDGNSATFTTNNNFINLSEVISVTKGRVWIYRISTGENCDWTEWCCVSLGQIDTNCSSTAGRKKDINNLKSSLQVYPNPAKDKFVVSSNDDNLSAIEVYNIYGRLVKNYKNINDQKLLITASDLPKGYYFVHILTENGNKINKKILIE